MQSWSEIVCNNFLFTPKNLTFAYSGLHFGKFCCLDDFMMQLWVLTLGSEFQTIVLIAAICRKDALFFLHV